MTENKPGKPTNPNGKLVSEADAYSVLESNDGAGVYFVRKHYQGPYAEYQNPWARVRVTYRAWGHMYDKYGETGDMYLHRLQETTHLLDFNPLARAGMCYKCKGCGTVLKVDVSMVEDIENLLPTLVSEVCVRCRLQGMQVICLLT